MNKKLLLKIIITIVIIALIIILLPFVFPRKYAVLTYHDFTTGKPENSMQKNIDDFKKEMKYLKKHNYKTLTLSDVECYMNKKCKLPRKSVLITFDDGWKSEYELALPILKEYGFNAVIFYIGDNIDGDNANFMSKDELFEIKNNYPNIEIASHTFNNHKDDAYTKTVDELNQDFKSMKNIVDTKYFAYPYGLYSESYIKALKKNRYSLAFTFGGDAKHKKFNNNDNRYLIPRLNLSTDYPYWKFVLRMYLPF